MDLVILRAGGDLGLLGKRRKGRIPSRPSHFVRGIIIVVRSARRPFLLRFCVFDKGSVAPCWELVYFVSPLEDGKHGHRSYSFIYAQVMTCPTTQQGACRLCVLRFVDRNTTRTMVMRQRYCCVYVELLPCFPPYFPSPLMIRLFTEN